MGTFILACVCAVLGGAFLKYLEYKLSAKSDQVLTTHTALRGEIKDLRNEVQTLAEEVRKANAESAYWREKYEDLKEQSARGRSVTISPTGGDKHG